MSDNKDRLTYRPEPETKQKIERWYQEDNCRSILAAVSSVMRKFSLFSFLLISPSNLL